MNAIAKQVNAVLVKKFGFRMYIQGGDFDGHSHYSWSFKDAVEWMACYGGNVQKYIFNRKGTCIAYHYAYLGD